MTLTNENFMKWNIKNNQIQRILAAICFRIFCFPTCCLKMKILKYTTLSSWLFYCMGFNLSVFHEGKTIDRPGGFVSRVVLRILGCLNHAE